MAGARRPQVKEAVKNTLFIVFLFTAGFAAAQPVVVSSAPSPAEVAVSSVPVPTAADTGRVMLNISKNSASSRVGLDYSLRWDFSDLSSFNLGLGSIVSGITSWDITENTRVNYYGFKTNPWLVIFGVDRIRPAAAAPAAGQAAGGKIVSSAAPHKRLRLSVSPLVEDFERNFDENLRDFLLKNSLKGVSPQWQKTSDQGKRAFMRDVLSLGMWDSTLPGVAQGRDGLEYISGKTVVSTGTK